MLTINDSDKFALQKQVIELQENSKTNEYIIKGKLHEKDEEVKILSKKFSSMESQMQTLISTLGNMDESSKNQIAKRMIQAGVYTKDITTD